MGLFNNMCSTGLGEYSIIYVVLTGLTPLKVNWNAETFRKSLRAFVCLLVYLINNIVDKFPK